MNSRLRCIAITFTGIVAAGCGKGDKGKAADQAAGSATTSAKPAATAAAPTPAPAPAPTTTKRPVGAFTIDVPSTWQDVSAARANPGQLGLQLRDNPAVVLVLSPAPSPMPFDPTDPAACATNGARVHGVVGTPTVVDLPAGKACVVITVAGKRTTMTVLAVGDKGVMAQCEYDATADADDCEPLVRSLALVR